MSGGDLTPSLGHQWVTMPRPHWPVSYLEETASQTFPPLPLPGPKKAPWAGEGGGGCLGGRRGAWERDFIFPPLLEMTVQTVASKEQTLFSGRRTGLRFI